MRRHITEDRERDFVRIDNVEFSGWIAKDRPCSICGASQIYHDDYDAYFCPTCNAWLESRCGDASCLYCRQRPERPLPKD
jgi:hypothetical protein